MEVYEAVSTVLAVREFREECVEDTIINKIIQSARLT